MYSLSSRLSLLIFSFSCLADSTCPGVLIAGDLIFGGQAPVLWQGRAVPMFREGRRTNELAFLRFLSSHPNKFFTADQITQELFPWRMIGTSSKRRTYIHQLKFYVFRALKELDDSFENLRFVSQSGFIWIDQVTQAKSKKVGLLRVTDDQVFWKNKRVPRFGRKFQHKRQILSKMLDQVGYYVQPASADLGSSEQVFEALVEMQTDFEEVDPDFAAIRYSAPKGFAWMRAKRNESNPRVLPKRYRFRGRNLNLTNGTRALLESLLERAPDVVSQSELLSLILNGRDEAGYNALYLQMRNLRGEVGGDAIKTFWKEGSAWVAEDRPEVIEPAR